MKTIFRIHILIFFCATSEVNARQILSPNRFDSPHAISAGLYVLVPLRICILENAPVSQKHRVGSSKFVKRIALSPLLKEVNKIWEQAEIIFYSPILGGYPIIDYMQDIDRDRPKNDGTIDGGTNSFGGSVGAYHSAKICDSVWSEMHPNKAGLIVLIVKGFTGDSSSYLVKGIAAGFDYSSVELFCNSEFKLEPEDIYRNGTAFGRIPHIAVLDPTLVTDEFNDFLRSFHGLSHELGHALYLDHGNGLDDDGDSTGSGVIGRKRFDKYCDPSETNVSGFPNHTCEEHGSLMAANSSCTKIRPLQIEWARRVGSIMPGASNKWLDFTKVEKLP